MSATNALAPAVRPTPGEGKWGSLVTRIGLASSFSFCSLGRGQRTATAVGEGCRAVSKIEYDTAKREYIVISKGGRYLQTGYFWRRHYWWCHV